jgi:hypothetical protein
MTLAPNCASDEGERSPEVAPGAAVTAWLWNHGPVVIPVVFDPVPASTAGGHSPEMARAASVSAQLARPARACAVGIALAVVGPLFWRSGRGRTPW